MSVTALTITFRAKLGKSSTKAVLVALADRADDVTGTCFPSVADIVERTELNRKTVLSCLQELEQRKFLQDTGERCGKTKQVKIWRLDLALLKQTSVKSSQNWDGSAYSPKPSQYSTKTVPKTGYGTAKEPSSNQHPGGQAGGVGDDISSKPSAPVGQERGIRGGLEEFVAAATWMQLRTGGVRSPVGFKSKVRSRITAEGPNAEDWDTLKLWRASQSKPAPAENPEAMEQASERLQRLVDAKRRYSVLDVVRQAELELRFSEYLQASNGCAYNIYRKSGLDSIIVNGVFNEWLVGILE